MSEIKSLAFQDAVDKIKELAEGQPCMFCTHVNGRLQSRPMSTQQIDDEGNIWFLSGKSSHKNLQIKEGSEIDLLYANGIGHFLAVHGEASITTDKEKIKELWQPLAQVWFTEGVDDPEVSAIMVSIQDGYYWDSKHGRIVEFAKMAASLVTGKTMDDGIEGKLELDRS
jgi:general stress protein 26